MDHLGLFIEEECEIGPDHSVGSSDLMNVYNNWLFRQGQKSISGVKFSEEMTKKGYEKKRGKNGQRWYGIRKCIKEYEDDSFFN